MNSSGGTLTAELKDKIEGDRQTMGVGRIVGQEKTHGMDKMDTEGNSQEGKTGNLEV